MTPTSLTRYLRISGWAAIIATFVNKGLLMIHRAQRMSEMGIEGELRASTFAIDTVVFGLQLPVSLTIACLCLVAARVLTFKQQTIQSVFE